MRRTCLPYALDSPELIVHPARSLECLENFGFTNSRRGFGSQVSDNKQTLSIGGSKATKIAVQGRGIGTTEREAHETS
jgi:hypothetical protein